MSDFILCMGVGGELVGGSFWVVVGGCVIFEKLVCVFYVGVVDDEVLWFMYFEYDLEGVI